MAWRRLTPQQWAAIRIQLPEAKPSPRGGRPRVDDRRCVAGILWILWTGSPWRELPRRYGSPSTCGRRLTQWEETGVLLRLWRVFFAHLNDRQKLHRDECVADGRFVPAPKGAKVGKTKRGKGITWRVLVDGTGTPLGADLDAASPAEVMRLEKPLDTVGVGRPGKPGRPRKWAERLIADWGYDRKPLRARLARRRIALIIPARRHHIRATHQDGRTLWRYRRRWIVERPCAGLGYFRRLVVRYERLVTTDAVSSISPVPSLPDGGF